MKFHVDSEPFYETDITTLKDGGYRMQFFKTL